MSRGNKNDPQNLNQSLAHSDTFISYRIFLRIFPNIRERVKCRSQSLD